MNRIYIAAIFIFSFLIAGFFSVAAAKGETGAEMSMEHKSAVAGVVRDLKDLAGKDQNIGEEVRVVAQEQEESNDRAVEAMGKVETRSGFKTFFIGSDYKNIGILRSEIVTTQNHIDRLTRAKDRATSDEVKVDLDAQIMALGKANADAKAFAQDHEDAFSLFGWFAKLFQ